MSATDTITMNAYRRAEARGVADTFRQAVNHVQTLERMAEAIERGLHNVPAVMEMYPAANAAERLSDQLRGLRTDLEGEIARCEERIAEAAH